MAIKLVWSYKYTKESVLLVEKPYKEVLLIFYIIILAKLTRCYWELFIF